MCNTKLTDKTSEPRIPSARLKNKKLTKLASRAQLVHWDILSSVFTLMAEIFVNHIVFLLQFFFIFKSMCFYRVVIWELCSYG